MYSFSFQRVKLIYFYFSSQWLMLWINTSSLQLLQLSSKWEKEPLYWCSVPNRLCFFKKIHCLALVCGRMIQIFFIIYQSLSSVFRSVSNILWDTFRRFWLREGNNVVLFEENLNPQIKEYVLLKCCKRFYTDTEDC